MMDPPDALHVLTKGLEPPLPPAWLRDLAIAGATPALARPVPPDPWRRIWESRPARLAWAATVLALVAGNLLLPAPRPMTSAARAGLMRATDALAIAEVRDVAALPRIEVLPMLFEQSLAPSELRTGARPSESPREESRS